MISPPKRQGIDPHGSLLEPLWNLFRETILFSRWPSERKQQFFSELRGGRTRTRTLDPLIKSQVWFIDNAPLFSRLLEKAVK